MRKKNKKNKVLFFLMILVFAVVSFACVMFFEKKENKAVADVGCPDDGDWVGVGDFCITKNDDLFDGHGSSWESKAYKCANDAQGSRLCTTAEWVAACKLNEDGLISISGLGNSATKGPEWTADMTDFDHAIVVDFGNCETFATDQVDLGDAHSGRCCINKQY